MLRCWDANPRPYLGDTGSRLGLTGDRHVPELNLQRHYAEETVCPPKPGFGEWMDEDDRVGHTCQPELRFEFGVPMPTPNVLFDATLRCDGA